MAGDAGIGKVSVPLRGLDIRKPHLQTATNPQNQVSVPLRGLDIRKLWIGIPKTTKDSVSVPLRGLDIRKLYFVWVVSVVELMFQSPCGD